MSLINQMLKELDARRAESPGGRPFGAQIRVVPERRGVHPAWWLALALALALAGVLGWILSRPAPPDPYEIRAVLPLRMDAGLVLPAEFPEPIPAAEAGPAGASPSDPVADAALGTALPGAIAPEPAERLSSPPTIVASPSAAGPAKRMLREEEIAAAAAFRRASTLERVTSDVAGAEPVTGLEPQMPAKQVRELTSQQQAENAFRKASLAIQQERRTEALAALDQALKLDPRHAAARQTKIALLLDSKRNEDAWRVAHEGVELDARQIGLVMILARLQVERDEAASAIETLERSRGHALDRPDYLAFLAALLQRAERHRQAAENYALALRQAPNNGVWWMGLGLSLQAEQRTDEALDAYRRARDARGLSPELLAFVDARIAQLR